MTLPTEARPRSPQSPSYDTPSRLQGVLWASPFLLLVYGLGLWGYWQYRPPGSVPGEDGWDLAYYALQLFVLEFTATDGTPVPLVLKIARVVAPVILTGAVVTIIEIVRTTLLVRRLTRRGFALVVGDTAEARAVAEAKRRLSDKAVYEFATGDLVSPQALRAVGIRRADAVYALGDDREDVAANVATALAAVSARRARRTRILVHVTDPELVIGLRARRFMTEAGQLVEFFTMDEAAARAHVAQESFPAGEPPRILVAGAGAFGQAIVVEVARRWRDTPGRGEGRVEVVLVDASASAIAARLRERWVVVDRHCHLTPIDTTDPTAVLRDQPVIGRPHRAYICYEDEQVALRTALAAVPLWHGGPGSLVVRLSQLARHAEAFRTGGLLDDLEGRLVVANVADLGAPEVVRDRDIFWQLAEVVHERYLRNELAKGRQLGSTLALRPWAELRDDFRDNNYEQACHLAVKLRRIGATVAPRSDRNPPFALTDEEIEVLARLEHERWMANRRKHRWRYGPQRDDTRRIHPDLVPWEDLSEQSRQRDRDAVAAIPAEFGEVLAEFGLQIVRLAPTPASVPAQAVAPAG